MFPYLWIDHGSQLGPSLSILQALEASTCKNTGNTGIQNWEYPGLWNGPAKHLIIYLLNIKYDVKFENIYELILKSHW